MKGIFLLIILSLSLCVYSQEFKFKANYILLNDTSKLDIFEKEVLNNANYDELLKKTLIEYNAIDIFLEKNTKIILECDGENTICYFEGLMLSDKHTKLQKQLIEAKFLTKYYTDLTEKITYQNFPLYGSNFNVIMDKNEWIITNETKTIDRFLCFKALSSKNQEITVWFTYDIPIGSGPLDFTNAPGLILEVNAGSQKYILESMIFEKLKFNKVKMPKGEIVTKQEMDNIAKKARQAQYGRQ